MFCLLPSSRSNFAEPCKNSDRFSTPQQDRIKERAFGKFGRGSVHHVAWRVEDDAHEIDVRRKLIELGQKPTEQDKREAAYYQINQQYAHNNQQLGPAKTHP